MLRRFIFLMFVAGTSGTVGLWLGLLYAPAPGAETRARLTTVLEDHEGTFDDLLTRGREAVTDVLDVVSGTVNAEDEG